MLGLGVRVEGELYETSMVTYIQPIDKTWSLVTWITKRQLVEANVGTQPITLR